MASCQFGIIDMIQLREVTATLCIFKGPQWLHLCCWLLAFECFYLVVKACCDVGMTCPEAYQKVTRLAPRTKYPAWSFPNELSSPSHMAALFLMCKIDLKMPFLKLPRWIQAKQVLAPVIGRPQWQSFECDQLGAIFIMLSLCQ